LSGNLRRHSSVFSSRLKTNSDEADVPSAGKLFQTRTAATEKERSPCYWWRGFISLGDQNMPFSYA